MAVKSWVGLPLFAIFLNYYFMIAGYYRICLTTPTWAAETARINKLDQTRIRVELPELASQRVLLVVRKQLASY
jgi:hypothetical protein